MTMLDFPDADYPIPDHEHKYGAVEHSRITETAHRKCTVDGCRFVSLDLHDDELTNWTVSYACRNANGVAWIGEVTVYACEDTVEDAADYEIRSGDGPAIVNIILVDFTRQDPSEDA